MSRPFATKVVLEGQALLDAVKVQIEFWFSGPNLTQDTFLRGKIESDPNHSVDLSTVMAFQKLQALSQDEQIIRQAIATSTLVSLENNKIKLLNAEEILAEAIVVKAPGGKRDIILREIPGDVPVDEVREIFNYDGCKPISEIRPEIGNMWYVTFDSEEDAKDSLMQLKLLDRKFRGANVKARLKPEPTVKAYPPAAAMQQRSFGYAGQGRMQQPFYNLGHPIPGGIRVPQMGFGGGDVQFYIDPNAANVNNQANPAAISNQANNFQPSGLNNFNPHTQQHNKQGGGALNNNNATMAQSQVPATKKDNKPADASTNAGRINNNNGKDVNPNTHTQGRNKQHEPRNNQSNQQQSHKASGTARSGDAKHGGNNNSNNNSSGPRIDISTASFPPLALSEDSQGPGYKVPYVKYKQDEIIEIVRKVADAKIPDELNPSQHPLAMDPNPNLDLLQRQRSYSIDEAKEQLQQGKPIHQAAIITPDVTTNVGGGATANNSKSASSKAGKEALTVKSAFSSWASVAKTEAAIAPKVSNGTNPVGKTSKAPSVDNTVDATVASSGNANTSSKPEGGRREGKKDRDSVDHKEKGGKNSGSKDKSRGDEKKEASKNQSEQKEVAEAVPAPNTWAKNLFKQ